MHIAHSRAQNTRQYSLFKEYICISTTAGCLGNHFSPQVFSRFTGEFYHRVIVLNVSTGKIFFNVNLKAGKTVTRCVTFIIFNNFLKGRYDSVCSFMEFFFIMASHLTLDPYEVGHDVDGDAAFDDTDVACCLMVDPPQLQFSDGFACQ